MHIWKLPSSKEITNIDEINVESIIRDIEERERKAEEHYKKTMVKAVFLLNNRRKKDS